MSNIRHLSGFLNLTNGDIIQLQFTHILHVSMSGYGTDDRLSGPYFTSSIIRPFSTIQAAINAASAGELVWVHPGIYNEKLILKNGVHLWFDAGATIDYTATIDGEYLLTDNGQQAYCVIGGYGQFRLSEDDGEGGSFGDTVALYTSHPSSQVIFNAAYVLTPKSYCALCINGTQIINVTYIDSLYGCMCEAGKQSINTESNVLASGKGLTCDGGLQTLIGNINVGSNSVGATCTGGTQIIKGNITLLNSGSGVQTFGGQQTLYGDIYSADANGLCTFTWAGNLTVIGGKLTGNRAPIQYEESGSGVITLRDCEVIQTYDDSGCLYVPYNTSVVLVARNTKFLVKSTANYALSSDTYAVNVKISHCCSNKTIAGTHVTNLIASPLNVENANI